MTKLKCSIGVIAFNEEQNIGNVLRALLSQRLDEVEIGEIIVVSSGSTDRTDVIVQGFVDRYSQIKLFLQPERRGKSSAINLFLSKAKYEILVIESADTIPGRDTVEKLVSPFKNEQIGMSGGRPTPLNKKESFVDFSVHLLWKMHHRLAMFRPKLGEMIAFRKVFSSIAENSAVDEASIEALITGTGLKCLYVSDAIVWNKGPETICEFISQRKRIAIGHLWLKDNQNYLVSSSFKFLLFGLYLSECIDNPKDIIKITAAAGLELFCRFLGRIDYHIKKSNPFIWEMVRSSKNLETGNKDK